MDATKDPSILKLDAELEALFKKRGHPPSLPTPTRANVLVLRKGFEKVTARFNSSPFARRHLPSSPTWTEHDTTIPARDGTAVDIRIYTPDSAPKTSHHTTASSNDSSSDTSGHPIALLFHGGGWFMGSLSTEAFLCQLLCHRHRMVVINVGFRLYPDVDFPVPITDCFDVLRYLCASDNLASLCPTAKPDALGGGFLLVGVSGGGTYASVLSHLAQQQGLTPKITGLFLACPVLSDNYIDETTGEMKFRFGERTQRSHLENADAPLMNSKMRDGIAALANFQWGSEYMTPFNHLARPTPGSTANGLPRTYTQVCTLDPWRDSGIVYAEELARRGVQTKVDVYKGMPHCWWADVS